MHFLKATMLTASLVCASNAAATTPAPAWLAGHWCVERNGNTTEELWLPPHGGVMIGLGRTRNTEDTTGFEYLRIIDVDGVQSLMAQPNGNPPVTFRRTGGGGDWVRFENPDHDFPQRIEYRREAGSLSAEISGPGEGDEDAVIVFDYKPCGQD